MKGPVQDASRQMAVLGGLYMLLTVVIYGTLACFAGGASRWLRASPARAARLRRITGTSFIGLGFWAAVPDRR